MPIYTRFKIYQFINHVTNKRYIGSTNNIIKRQQSHVNALLNNKHINKKLQHAFNKYGVESFSFQILDDIINHEELEQKERFWIDYYNSVKEGYNIFYPDKRRSGPGQTTEERKLKDREYKIKNKEKYKCTRKKWRQENLDKVKLSQKKWNNNNEECLNKMRERKNNNRNSRKQTDENYRLNINQRAKETREERMKDPIYKAKIQQQKKEYREKRKALLLEQ
ncbi:GIY-YIG nuclease family protein [Candidatus Dojkabacteria bacterium]|jgi:group I intron endonuclease|nr:GIY-YIG nuclease family protein [Candidatus Dojkabacteria bacterium]